MGFFKRMKRMVCKQGDIWLLGDHTVFCGDATDEKHTQALMVEDRAELLFTSPPYLDRRTYGKNDLSTENIKKFIRAFYPYCQYQVVNLGILRKNHEIIEYWQEYIQFARECGYKFLSWNVWDKQRAGSVRSATAMFTQTHEWLFVFGKQFKRINRTIPNKLEAYEKRHGKNWREGIEKTVRQKDDSLEKTTSKAYEFHQLHSVTQQNCEMGKIRNLHPAVFPVGLPKSYIEAMTNPGDIVVDPFGGSGTTLIACEQTKRRCRMMEIFSQYVDVIITRWQKETGLDAVDQDGRTFNERKK